MKKIHKLLTLEQLVKFCEEKKFYTFNSKDFGYTLSVQVPGDLYFENDSTQGLLFATVKVCHTELNRNGSFISEDNMKQAMPSLKYRPFLAYIHQLDSGEYDFHGHDMEIVKGENGEDQIVYKESQVGTFTADEPYLEYDKDMDKTYVKATVAIPEDYTLTADIIRRKNGTKVSAELCIDSMSYNAKDKYLELEDFYFSGCTALGAEKDGTQIGEGMLGSRLDIADFSTANNSICTHYNVMENQKLIETLDKLSDTLSILSNFNINHNAEGKEDKQVNKFEELLGKYNKTKEDITFEYEGLTDKELEAAFAEAFNESDPEPDLNDPEPEVFQKVFELSHSDIRYALYNLLSPFEDADNEWYFINSVYDSHFTYENWDGNKIYGQNYTKDGDNVAFDGERYNLHRELLTDAEYAELQSMRSNYAEIKTKLEGYQKAEENANKDALFVSDDYKAISTENEFITLSENHADYSLDELKSKLDSMLLSYAKSGNLNFSVKEEKQNKTTNKVGLPFNSVQKKRRYGSLFSK